MAGTSMATPVTAGNGAVVRQYFRQGYFQNSSSLLDSIMIKLVGTTLVGDSSDGSNNEFTGLFNPPSALNGVFSGRNGGFTPSAALVKAVLINGAVPLTGYLCTGDSEIDMELSMRSHVYEGYGRVSLSDSLSLFKANPHFSLEVLGMSHINGNNYLNEPIIAHQEVHEYCFESFHSNGQDTNDDESDDVDGTMVPLSATLVWTDPPVSPASSHYLAHDLDLIISFHNKHRSRREDDDDAVVDVDDIKLYRGNNNPVEDNHIPDSINNVEKIRLLNLTKFRKPHTFMKVTVEGSHVAYGNQKYALVVSGVHIKPTNCNDYQKKKDSKIEYVVVAAFIVILFLFVVLVYCIVECKKSYRQSKTGGVISSTVPPASSATSPGGNAKREQSTVKKQIGRNKYKRTAEHDDDSEGEYEEDRQNSVDSTHEHIQLTQLTGGGGGGEPVLTNDDSIRYDINRQKKKEVDQTRNPLTSRYDDGDDGGEDDEVVFLGISAEDSIDMSFV
jgi:hypothetical protein